jgi:hypothetical protein
VITTVDHRGTERSEAERPHTPQTMGNYAGKDISRGNLEGHETIPSRSVPKMKSYQEEPSSQTVTDPALLADQMGGHVPTVFKWEHGGRNIYITGTFNNWERQIPMHRSVTISRTCIT